MIKAQAQLTLYCYGLLRNSSRLQREIVDSIMVRFRYLN